MTLECAIAFAALKWICVRDLLKPFLSITVAAEGKNNSDGLKHGFRFHRKFTTGQKKKPHYQWDLHRLVRCRADLHVTVPGLILFQAVLHLLYTNLASNLCGSESKHESCSWTSVYVRSAVGGIFAGACGYEAFGLLNSYRLFYKGNLLRNFSNDKQNLIFLDTWILFNIILRTQNQPPAVYNVEHNHEEQMQWSHEKDSALN
jgi:hypothetical protein